MTEIILKTTGVTKKYGQHKALADVSIEIRRGMIYGLIGENGAGKSTFMRAIMGLIETDTGTIELFGQHDTKGLQQARRKMGQSIEMPALYPELTARENLQVQAANGGVDETEIERLLTMMNLATTGRKHVKNFSLGMRQRLAIAVTLVTNPEFLILDEPTNGLDPAGIAEIREIILQLVNERGLTVLISSHLLNELSLVATHYGILHHGRLIRELSKEQIAQESQQYIEIELADAQAAIPILDQMQIADYTVVDAQHINVYQHNQAVAQINRALVLADIAVTRIGVTQQQLEDYFLNLTGGEQLV
ncbi:ATP-binding cassette domain-containing protein [Loigolactobacillus zhaoyuanensis]|uniref:ATP-binding cassette domain-containing protein n=1 Tax=Loigolactobacillus zhaoyuanensis TaxID=2486017 RepID=A0ABW8UGC5_9LACO|nr:ATP-binding cassette domain-containing protein [Loigolactobacillus zhaoyuanensis]